MKPEERQRLLAWRRALNAEERAEMNRGCQQQAEIWLLQHRQRHPETGDAHHPIAVYMPVSGEPDLLPVYTEWQRAGLHLALPCVVQKESALQFLAWQPGATLSQDLCGIAIPAMAHAVTPAVMLIPCVGYTRTGYRLGYGGGYYDRTLALPGSVHTAGVAFEQCLAQWPVEPHDRPLQTIITERWCLNL